MRWSKRIQKLAMVGIGLVCLAGCGELTKPAIQAWQKQYLSSSPLDAAERIEAITAQEAFQSPEHEGQVAIIGQIGGSSDCFDQSMAAFLMIDVDKDGHASTPGHDPDECAFCKRRRADAPTALVQFLDDKQQPIAMSAKEIFGLQKGQTVLVEGRGRFDKESKTLFVSASRIHLPKP